MGNDDIAHDLTYTGCANLKVHLEEKNYKSRLLSAIGWEYLSNTCDSCGHHNDVGAIFPLIDDKKYHSRILIFDEGLSKVVGDFLGLLV